MKNRLVIAGAGGHAMVCAEIARLTGYENIIFLDDAETAVASGKISDFELYLGDSDFFTAIGNNKVRKEISDRIEQNGGRLITLIHPSAVVSSSAKLKDGCVLMAGSVVNANASIEKGTIINTCASVDHDCRVGEYSHIAVGAHLTGSVVVGDCSIIGAGAVVINNISICGNCVVGAGAAVIKDISQPGVYVGTPAVKVH